MGKYFQLQILCVSTKINDSAEVHSNEGSCHLEQGCGLLMLLIVVRQHWSFMVQSTKIYSALKAQILLDSRIRF